MELTGVHAARPSPPDLLQDQCLLMRSLQVGPDRSALHLTVTQLDRRKPASLLVSKPANAFTTGNPTSGDAPREGEAGRGRTAVYLFAAMLLTAAKRWTPPKCLSRQWINSVDHPHEGTGLSSEELSTDP